MRCRSFSLFAAITVQKNLRDVLAVTAHSACMAQALAGACTMSDAASAWRRPAYRFGASHDSSWAASTPRRALMSASWSAPILPTTKYFDSGWAK